MNSAHYFVAAVLACVAPQILYAHAADLSGHRTVSLVSPTGDPIAIADVEIRGGLERYSFEAKFKRDAFRQIYMQETNFLCLPIGQLEICHFTFPPGDYAAGDSSGSFTDDDLKELEYALLFVRKRAAPADIDIDPFNGMYYRLTIVGNRIEGTVFGADFNRLIVSDDKEKYPIKPEDLDAVDLRTERFPHLVIE